jgi:hypothetical protein
MVTQRQKAKYDQDGDGSVSKYDIMKSRELLELDLQEEKATTQKRMAWWAMFLMAIFTLALFLPIVPVERVAALADLLGLFYIAQAGVVGAYMGVTAWMSTTGRSRAIQQSSSRYQQPNAAADTYSPDERG